MTDAPPQIRVTMDHHLRVTGLPEVQGDAIVRALTLPNPKWLENQRMGRWNGRTEKELRFFEKKEDGPLLLPRGFARTLLVGLKRQGLAYDFVDNRRELPEIDFPFLGTLRDFQETAVAAMLEKEFGTLNAPTGAGKTVMALALIARRKQPALIVVHTRELALQWVERIGEFLGIPEREVGFIGGGRKKISETINVALVQSLLKCKEELEPKIGHIIVDECHRTPSKTFTEAVSAFSARYSLGLSATLFRRDNLADLIFWYLGDAHHHVDKRHLLIQGDILKVDVTFRKTEFRPHADPVKHYSKMMKELVTDDLRNRMIAQDVKDAHDADPGAVMLVLSDRKEHCRTISSLLKFRHHVPVTLLTGDLSILQRRTAMEALTSGEAKVLVATGQLVGEGFDFKALSTLFLATPIRFSGRVLQYLGRILRPAPGKEKARVVDYVDLHVDVLVKAARERQQVYATTSDLPDLPAMQPPGEFRSP